MFLNLKNKQNKKNRKNSGIVIGSKGTGMVRAYIKPIVSDTNEMPPEMKIRWIDECKKVLENDYRRIKEPYFETVYKMSVELLKEYQEILIKTKEHKPENPSSV